MGNELTWVRLGKRVSVQQVSEKQENNKTLTYFIALQWPQYSHFTVSQRETEIVTA